MSRASIPTLLSLDRYFAIMGVAPAHANGAYGISGGKAPFPLASTCGDVWMQYDWQGNGRVSREALAEEIAKAEEDIALALGYWPAPVWTVAEKQMYPPFHRPDMWSTPVSVKDYQISVEARWGKIINGGQCGKTLICNPCLAREGGGQCTGTLVFSDEDDDDYDETVTVTCQTEIKDVCELHVFFAGHAGDPTWEIRPPRSVTLVGGVATFVFWAWQLIDPLLWEKLPPNDGTKLGLDLNGAIYVSQVELYRIFNDLTAISSEFGWEPTAIRLPMACSECGGLGCPNCTVAAQYGCLHVRDADAGIVVPAPGTYDPATAAWLNDAFINSRRPDMVRLWYYSGDQSQQRRCETNCEALSNYWAQTIAWLATARLGRPVCGCQPVSDYAKELQQNSAFSSEAGKIRMSDEDLENPFGTRIGEVRAWKRIAKLAERRMMGVTI